MLLRFVTSTQITLLILGFSKVWMDLDTTTSFLREMIMLSDERSLDGKPLC